MNCFFRDWSWIFTPLKTNMEKHHFSYENTSFSIIILVFRGVGHFFCGRKLGEKNHAKHRAGGDHQLSRYRAHQSHSALSRGTGKPCAGAVGSITPLVFGGVRPTKRKGSKKSCPLVENYDNYIHCFRVPSQEFRARFLLDSWSVFWVSAKEYPTCFFYRANGRSSSPLKQQMRGISPWSCWDHFESHDPPAQSWTKNIFFW